MAAFQNSAINRRLSLSRMKYLHKIILGIVCECFFRGDCMGGLGRAKIGNTLF